MNSLVLWNILSFILFSYGWILLLVNRRKLQLTQGEFYPLIISIILYSLIALSNTMEHSGITDIFDPYEDVCELTFLFMCLFFINNWRAQRDYGKLKDRESRLKTALKTLSEKENEYKTLVENANDAIFVVQHERIVFANDKTAILLGFGSGNTSEKPFIEYIHPEDQWIVSSKITGSADGKQDNLANYKLRVISQEKGELIVQMNSVRIVWLESPAILCFARDIKELVKLQEKLFHSQKMESIGTLAGGVAHDFNNILTAIIGYTELAKGKTGNDSVKNDLEKVMMAGDRAKYLVKQILNISRQSQSHLVPVEVHLVISEAIKLLRSSIPTTIKIEQEIDKQSGLVLSDPTHIHQIIMNLCTNAYHAMRDRGSGTLSLSLKKKYIGPDDSLLLTLALGPGEYLELTVCDTGVGIKKEIISKIFDPYYTTKMNDEGTGLGLAVVQGIIKSYGGYISVYSEYGKGSTFCIYLPRHNSKVLPKEQIIPPDCPRGTERGLVVDDELLIAEMVANMLKSLGYDVSSTTDSRLALDMFKDDPGSFDFIFTDMTMPEMDGVQLIKEIRKVNDKTPIILCTGFSEFIDSNKADLLGVKFFMKPILKMDLSLAVREVLDREPSTLATN